MATLVVIYCSVGEHSNKISEPKQMATLVVIYCSVGEHSNKRKCHE